MIGLDTNILVRLLTRDDEKQAEKARALIERYGDNEAAFFISDIVLAELAWTLERSYELDRESISRAFEALAGNVTLAIEARPILRAALGLYTAHKAGFADCLIAAKAQQAGCKSLVTFDKGMKTLPGVELL